MQYSAQTGGFYDREIHGDAIPADAVDVTAEEYAALLAGQGQGKIIAADADGRPVLQDRPSPLPDDLIKQQIAAIEATITLRRQREAILGIDNGWLSGANSQIEALRAQLT